MFRFVLCLTVVLKLTAVADAGQTCKDSAGNSPCTGTNSPCVCVEFSGGTPLELTDFTFDVVTDPNPDVTFKTGSQTWNVWSQVHASNTTPANLGDIRLDTSSSSENFLIEIKNPNNGNPGAAGTWSIRLYGYGVTGNQPVYYAIGVGN